MSHSVVGDRLMFVQRRSLEQQSAKVCYQHFECDSRKFYDWIYCSDKRFVMKNFVAVLDWMTCQALCSVTIWRWTAINSFEEFRFPPDHRANHIWRVSSHVPPLIQPVSNKLIQFLSQLHMLVIMLHFFWPLYRTIVAALEGKVLLQFLNTSLNSLFRSSLHKVKSLIVLIWWLSRLKHWSLNSPMSSKTKKRLGL